MRETMSFWLENAMAEPPSYSPTPSGSKPPHLLLDVGYWRDPGARERAEAVIACIGKSHKRRKNGEVVGFGRILIRIPAEKLAALLQQHSAIQEGGGYCWTTHSWLPDGAGNVKYAG